MTTTYEVEVQHGDTDRAWHLFHVSDTPRAAEAMRKRALEIGYAAARILKVTREVVEP